MCVCVYRKASFYFYFSCIYLDKMEKRNSEINLNGVRDILILPGISRLHRDST